MAYKKQAYIVNPIIMAVLLVIFSFVTLFKFFNYNTNILDPFQFNVILGLLHIFGIVGIVLAMGLEGDKNHPIENCSVPEKDVTDGGTKSSDFTKRILCCKSLLCVLLVLIILCSFSQLLHFL